MTPSVTTVTYHGLDTATKFKRQKQTSDPALYDVFKVWKDLRVLTSDEVTKEVSFRKQVLDRGLLLVLRGSKEQRGTNTVFYRHCKLL